MTDKITLLTSKINGYLSMNSLLDMEYEIEELHEVGVSYICALINNQFLKEHFNDERHYLFAIVRLIFSKLNINHELEVEKMKDIIQNTPVATAIKDLGVEKEMYEKLVEELFYIFEDVVIEERNADNLVKLLNVIYKSGINVYYNKVNRYN